jgi:hypothetical protein
MLTGAALVASASHASAQAVQGRTIVGIVVDTLGRPMDGVEVILENSRRSATTGADGKFRINDVPPARYTVVARKVGYYRAVARAVVANSTGAELRLELSPFAFGLPAVVTVSRRLGLSGYVSDEALKPLAGATVQIIGGTRRGTTVIEVDSTGRFHADLTPGSYPIWAMKDGYRAQFLSVTIPADSGREVAIVMPVASDRGSSVRERVQMIDMNNRLAQRQVVWSRLVSREDILRTPNLTDLSDLTRANGNVQISERCSALIDGGPFKAPLWSINSEEIEFIEIYVNPAGPGGVRRAGPRGPNLNNPARTSVADFSDDPLSNTCSAASVIVWLRK